MFLTASFICSLLVVAVQAIPPVHKAPPPPPGGPDDKVIFVSGALNPELLPEHVVWTMTLSGIAFMLEKKMPGGIEQMKLGPADLQVVLKEAKAQRVRDNVCEERQKKHRASLQASGLTQRQIFENMKDVIIECRWDVLRARDRILAELSPEGLVAFTDYVNRERVTISSTVVKEDWAFWYQPH